MELYFVYKTSESAVKLSCSRRKAAVSKLNAAKADVDIYVYTHCRFQFLAIQLRAHLNHKSFCRRDLPRPFKTKIESHLDCCATA